MIIMVEVKNSFRKPRRIRPGNFAAPVGGTIIHQDQLPKGVFLGKNAADCFFNEIFDIEEDHNAGDKGGRVSHGEFGFRFPKALAAISVISDLAI
jgi:hypothetical protein